MEEVASVIVIACMQVLNGLLVQGNIINSFLDCCWWPCIDAKRIFHSGLVYKNGGSTSNKQTIMNLPDASSCYNLNSV